MNNFKISNYIMTRLGNRGTELEFELVKLRISIALGIEWACIPESMLINQLNIIDESIRIIKLDRPSQLSMLE